jgi:3-keto-5-aminohexanoate cleavage enzyme
MEGVIIEVGLNESTTKAENPHVPYSPDEIATDILSCSEAGAAIVHFHARDAQSGANRLNDEDLYRESMRAVRAAGCDVLMYPTYPPAEQDPAERFRHVRSLAQDPDTDLEIGPLDMGSFNLIRFVDGDFAETAFMPIEASVYCNPFLQLRDMLAYFSKADLISSLAVFEPGHLRAICAFLKRSEIRGAPLVKFFLSEEWLFGPSPDVASLEMYARMLESEGCAGQVEWFGCPNAFSSPEKVLEFVESTIRLGGHVRLGIGDNPVASRGRSNAELVDEVAELARRSGRGVASPAAVLSRCRN